MGLQYLDKHLIGQYLTDAWKKTLNTNRDPANGRWYEDGANHDQIGLYGGLTDSLASDLIFDENQKVYAPQQIVVDSAIVDNRNGLTPSSTVQLTYTYAFAQSSSHATSAALKVGVGYEIKVKEGIIFAGAEETVKFSLEFSYSWTDTNTQTTTDTHTISQSVPVTVPSGKVYKVILSAVSQKLTVPYRALITVTGRSETWFESRVNGHYNWSNTAGALFQLINQYGSAGAESHLYGSQGDQGVVSLPGTLTAQQMANFKAQVLDVTATYQDSPTTPAAAARAMAGGEEYVPEGVVVQEISVK